MNHFTEVSRKTKFTRRGESHRNSDVSRRPSHSTHGRRQRRQGDERVTSHDQYLQQHHTQCLSKDDLEKLAQSSPENVLSFVSDNEAEFLRAYCNARYCQDPTLMKYLVKILHNLVTAGNAQIASCVLARILSASGTYAQFLVQLNMLIMKVCEKGKQDVEHKSHEGTEFLQQMVEIGLFCITVIPKSVLHTFPLDTLKVTVKNLVTSGDSVPYLDTKQFEQLVDEFSAARDELTQHSQVEQNATPADLNEPLSDPPQHFTAVRVLPTNEEVQMYAGKPYLRPNVISGGYQDWDHYLDVQFRLLREDFVAPLRDGITQHCEGRRADVHVYEGVSVLHPICLYTGMGFLIHFDVSRLGTVNWEHTKRLIFGSLLCLTRDDFENVIFATVVKRDPKLLQEGLLTVKFEDDTNGFQLDPSKLYTMVESSAYFEAYRHVLEGLQRISSNRVANRMPFKPYIVDCELQNVPMPRFLRLVRYPSFNLCDILKTRPALSNVLLSDSSTWPSPDKTCLDPSQFDALMNALTHEISVIQGPPGTGKTFIGLKIVEAYLKNRAIWDLEHTSPILVVCYTNHALDQFLEGIKQMAINGHEPNIVRIGGRCKTESLKNCVLREKVQVIRSQRAFPKSIFKPRANALGNLFSIKDRINLFVDGLVSAENQYKILKLPALADVITRDHSFQLRYRKPTEPHKEIEVWLGLWFPESTVIESDSVTEPRTASNNTHSLDSKNVTVEKQPLETASANDDEYIEVDAEARLLEDDRIMEGEEVELEARNIIANLKFTSTDQEENIFHNKDGWQTVQLSDEKRRKLIREGQRQRAMTEEEVGRVHDVWNLNTKQRWRLYKFWVNKYIFNQKNQLDQLGQSYNVACKEYQQCQIEMDNYVLQGVDVVGITTTGAAKHHHLLKRINPKIVIIEEAAEVFEAHVVSSLSPSVQQLILIGDHKQLRPKPNYYELEKKYGIAVSFFERLANNGLKYVTLTEQHRMRPEIAALVCPSIYPKLDNHPSVEKYDQVLGVGKNLFAINHNVPEESHKGDESRSHSNLFEAEYLVRLCKYLLKQGYAPNQITVLTMYRGQLLELRKRMTRKFFQGVRVAAVDDYQGEENDIILLSLVRSNSSGNIGFLSVSNRVCVSLSRARVGFYIIGNFSMLQDKYSTVWPQILADMEKNQCIGNALPLYCQLHPSTKIFAKSPQDFQKCPEGGCQLPCATRLECGHTCTLTCHPKDRDHKDHKCRKACGKLLPCGHYCKGLCFKCSDRYRCPQCTQMVEKTIPLCGHTVITSCSSDPALEVCTAHCDRPLSCGHPCQELCSNPCTTKCRARVTKTLPCKHTVKASCYRNPESIQCPYPCNALLNCGHRCAGTCGQCQGGRVHIPCELQCNRTLSKLECRPGYDQRIETVKAIGLSKGHWYKCPNGHYYCIGECEGAMQTAKCPDCGATVGGPKFP